MEKKRNTHRYSNEKILMVALVVVILVGCAVGGTIAYFTDTADPITNTFAIGAIGELELVETLETSKHNGSYVIVPGVAITKDPTITYTPEHTDDANKELNVGAYIFVKVSGGSWEQDASDKYKYSIENGAMEWTVNSTDWTHLEGNIFYHAVEPNTKDVFTSKFITNDSITVSGINVTNSNISTVQTAANNLKFEAFAIQKEGFENAAAAWAGLQSP